MGTGWPLFSADNATNGNPGWGIPSGNVPDFASPSPPIPKARVGTGKRLKLDNGSSIRREMARVYRGMNAGELDIVKGTKLIYALEVLSRAVERENVEKLADRLDAAEGK